jgi:hypothetical protein
VKVRKIVFECPQFDNATEVYGQNRSVLDAEKENSEEMQRDGWQAILNHLIK